MWALVGSAVVLLAGLVVWQGWRALAMPGTSYAGSLPPLTEAQATLRDALRADVTALADGIGERNVFRPGTLDRARDLLDAALRSAGYDVDAPAYDLDGRTVHNLVVEIPGGEDARDVVVVGAHYDSVAGSPGANDNATGVAAVLALARTFAGSTPRRTLRFVLFTNEEPPWFQTNAMGSRVYAKACRERGDRIVAMLSLETIGYYSDAENTQVAPFPLGLFFPSVGNFVAFIGNGDSRDLVRAVMRSFREHARFPSEGAALPGFVSEAGWSDHWSFWQEGWPALMVTDTAPFRYAQYHRKDDRPDLVDYDRLARVVDGLRGVVADLVGA